MENSDIQTIETAPRELSALARIFGDFLKRKSVLHKETISSVGERSITAREDGDSFIILDDQELEAVKANPMLTEGEKALLVLEGKKLYLYREHKNEIELAKAIAQRLKNKPALKPFTQEEILQAFLKPENTDFKPHENQIQAVTNCLESSFSIISGGPGTGKTTIITALVALELKRNPDIIIEIAAPTGKAAELLSAGLAKDCSSCSIKAKTLHSLFKAHPGTGKFGKNASSPLECDLLIVDECSMISLDTAARMFQGIRPDTRVVLSGDHRQLEAIGSGAVLSSLLTFTEDGSDGSDKLKKAGTELTANHRSKLAPAIQKLAKAMREGEDIPTLCRSILTESSEHYSFKNAAKDIEKEVLESAAKYWKELPETCRESTENSRSKAFETLRSFRILTAARVGSEGCSKLNEKVLEKLGMKSIYSPGSALLITQNCYRTGLSNGDVGIVFADNEKGGVKVCFEHLATPLKLHELPPHESAFAMTVHKAQGSGFAELCFPMPQKETPLLTRELFYTALTRAAKKITIYGSEEMVLAALKNCSCRSTALAERIVEILNNQ